MSQFTSKRQQLSEAASVRYYTRTAQVLHWVMALIFIAAWLIGFYASNVVNETLQPDLRHSSLSLHKNIASSLLFLIVIRIFWRYTHPVPQLPDSMSPTMQKLAHIGHLVLYLILVFLPISGVFYSWSAGRDVPVMFLFHLPSLIAADPNAKQIFHTIHSYLAWFAGLVVAGHIAAALKHHLIDKDNVFISMTRQPKS